VLDGSREDLAQPALSTGNPGTLGLGMRMMFGGQVPATGPSLRDSKQCPRTCNQEGLPTDEGAAATASFQIDQSCGACSAEALEGQEASV
jgi:hypothetical protein